MNSAISLPITGDFPPCHQVSAERIARLSAQIAYSTAMLRLSREDATALVRLGLYYLSHGYSAATAYGNAMKAAHRVALMNQFLAQRGTHAKHH